MNFDRSISGIEILDWRRIELTKGGEPRDLDWLLDIGGGISCSDLEKLKIIQD